MAAWLTALPLQCGDALCSPSVAHSIPHSVPSTAMTGVIDWSPHLPALFSHILRCFHVPVGTATASCPTSLGAPPKVAQLFGNKMDQVGVGVWCVAAD